LYNEYYSKPPIFGKEYEKFYIDRTPKFCNNQDRFVSNREELFELINPLGYQIIDCSYLSRLEQINIFKYAKNILTIHGSAETNIVYSEPGTKVYECNIREGWTYFKNIADRYGLDHRMNILEFGFGENIKFDIQNLKLFLSS
jgi:capsular polysaccharide biosynthesis protein